MFRGHEREERALVPVGCRERPLQDPEAFGEPPAIRPASSRSGGAKRIRDAFR
jgi:hypothetical protein